MNPQISSEQENEQTTAIVSQEEQVEVLPADTKGWGGKREGAGRPPSGRSQNIKYHFYQLLNQEAEAEDLQKAWNLLKQLAIDKALNNQDTEDLKWYLNRFIPQAREGGEINIDTTGNAPIITIIYDGDKE